VITREQFISNVKLKHGNLTSVIVEWIYILTVQSLKNKCIF